MTGSERYLLAIHQLSQSSSRVRTSDLARYLGVRPPSVCDMLARLARQGLVSYSPYQGVRLQPAGLEHARRLSHRARGLALLLRRLHVPEKMAEQDAQALERALSSTSSRQLHRFVHFMESLGEDPCFFSRFEQFCQQGGPNLDPPCVFPTALPISSAKSAPARGAPAPRAAPCAPSPSRPPRSRPPPAHRRKR